MKVIAISGWKQNGKDTVADYLVKNKQFKRVAFADKLKDMVSEEFNIPREHCDSHEYKERPILHLPVITTDEFSQVIHSFMRGEFKTKNGKGYNEDKLTEQLYWTPRALLILKGSVNRAVTSKYWVQRVINDVIKDSTETKTYRMFQSTSSFGVTSEPRFVISDMRYRSELKQLREAFGENLISVRINRYTTCPSIDPSERDLDNEKFDRIINNTGTLEELYEKVENLV